MPQPKRAFVVPRLRRAASARGGGHGARTERDLDSRFLRLAERTCKARSCY